MAPTAGQETPVGVRHSSDTDGRQELLVLKPVAGTPTAYWDVPVSIFLTFRLRGRAAAALGLAPTSPRLGKPTRR